MVVQVPSSAYVVPHVRIATSGEPILLTAAELGASRDEAGLRVDETRLEAVVAKLAARVSRPPEPARYELGDEGTLTYHRGTPGLELKRKAAKRVLVAALRGRPQGLKLPVREVPAGGPRQAIVARLSSFRLELYEGPRLERHFLIGVGRLGYHSHTGQYRIASKAVDPTWWNPGAFWSRGMPRYVPPGPNNPLGTRAMRLDRDLLAIHGAPDASTVGRRVSRGCMRMRQADVEELFELVEVGTPVFIFE